MSQYIIFIALLAKNFYTGRPIREHWPDNESQAFSFPARPSQSNVEKSCCGFLRATASAFSHFPSERANPYLFGQFTKIVIACCPSTSIHHGGCITIDIRSVRHEERLLVPSKNDGLWLRE